MKNIFATIFGGGCVVYIILITVYLWLSATSFQYLLRVVACKDLPWWADTIIGALISPVWGFIAWILVTCGIDVSFICP